MILVTGGTGLIGSHLLLDLTRKGRRIRALKRSTSNIGLVKRLFEAYEPDGEHLFSLVRWVDGDVEDLTSIELALQDVDEVYHCAAMVSFAERDMNRMLEVNVQGTANMIDAGLSAGVKKFCHVSSVAALGTPVEGNLVNEDAIWGKSKGNSGYAVSKFRSEMEVWRGIEQGLKAVIVNPSVIVGPSRWDSGSGQIFGTVAKGFPFYTQGITGYVDVRDVVDAMQRAMERELWGNRFVINGENISHREVFNLIAAETGNKPPHIRVTPLMASVAWRLAWFGSLFTSKNPPLTKDTAKSGFSVTYYSDLKARTMLGINPRSVADAVKNTVRVGSL